MKNYRTSMPKVRKTTRLGYVRFRLHDHYFSVGHYENKSNYVRRTGLDDMPEDARELDYFARRVNNAEVSGLATIIQYADIGGGLDYACACKTLMDFVNKKGGLR